MQVTLLWEDQTQRHLLASTRLYFLPEDTPKGRTGEHGEVGERSRGNGREPVRGSAGSFTTSIAFMGFGIDFIVKCNIYTYIHFFFFVTGSVITGNKNLPI